MSIVNIKPVVFIILLITALISRAQLNNPEYDQLMWGDSDPNAQTTTFPDKWKDESAVILYRSELSEFRKQVINNVVNEDSYFRQRIMLLDQTAVNEFSEFSTDMLNKSSWGRNADFLGIKIIKPDGSFHIVSESDFVEMKQKGNKGYGNYKYDKLALPNLSIGDIIDFYFVSIVGHSTNPNGTARITFNPVFKLLQADYPIVSGKFSIIPERKTFFNAAWLNGAPEPKITKNKKWNSYVFEYGDLEKASHDQMVFPYREYPVIIYQIIIAPKTDSDIKISFLGNYGEIKTDVSEHEVKMLLKKLSNYDRLEGHSYTMLESGVNDVNKMLQQNYSNIDVAKSIFYFMRHYMYFKTIYYFGYTVSLDYFIDDFDFVTAASTILNKYNISHEIGVCMPRTMGTTKNLVIHDQLVPFIRINDTVPIYITKPGIYGVFGRQNLYIEGVEATYINPGTNDLLGSIRKDTIPISAPRQSMQIDSMFVDIEKLSPVSINIQEKYFLTGSQKNYLQNIMTTNYDIYLDESDIYSAYDVLRKKDIKYIEENLEYYKKHEAEYIATRNDMVDIMITQTKAVDKVTIDTIVLDNIGRWSNSDTLKYKLSYTINEGISKANNFYILHIGKLIGKNKVFTDEEIDRKTNIYIDSPHKVTWALILNIPEGYEIQGYETLNAQTENTTGSFSTKARIENNRLIIDVAKIYKYNYYPLEQWSKMLEFMDAAVDFTQKQVLLVPISE